MSFLKKPIEKLKKQDADNNKVNELKKSIANSSNRELIIKKYIELITAYEEGKNFIYAQHYAEELLNLDQNNITVKIKLAHHYLINHHATKSLELVKELLEDQPDNLDVLNLSGEQNRILGRYENVEKIFKKILKISPDKETLVMACSNICGALIVQEKFEEALEYGLKGYKVNPKHNGLLMNLINALVYNKRLDEAFERVKDLEEIEPLNPTIGSIGLYLNEQLELNHRFKIFSDPFLYIKEYKIDFPKYPEKDSLGELINTINKIPREWEPKNKSTNAGFQTQSSLFSEYKDEYSLKRLSNIILSKISEYKISISDSEDFFVKDFPMKFSLNGWAVILKKLGNQNSHNHPSGWVSGVVYLKVPKKISGNEGKIEFSTHGYNFPKINSKIKKQVILPQEGSLILFPSLLYHKTIPFVSDEERISIAFDIYPIH